MKILFYGGTGQSKVMRPLADKVGSLEVVLDDSKIINPPFEDIECYNGNKCFENWKKNTKDYKEYFFVITIGNPYGKIRRNLSHKLTQEGLKPLSLLHPTSIIEKNASIGTSFQLHAGSYIGVNCYVGNHCIVNTKASIDHDCVLNHGSEVGPNATLCGEVMVGENTWIGAGSVVKHKIKIGRDVIVGAGSVVVKDVPNGQVVVGNPAKFLKKNSNIGESFE